MDYKLISFYEEGGNSYYYIIEKLDNLIETQNPSLFSLFVRELGSRMFLIKEEKGKLKIYDIRSFYQIKEKELEVSIHKMIAKFALKMELGVIPYKEEVKAEFEAKELQEELYHQWEEKMKMKYEEEYIESSEYQDKLETMKQDYAKGNKYVGMVERLKMIEESVEKDYPP